jgi:hypothetical protein
MGSYVKNLETSRAFLSLPRRGSGVSFGLARLLKAEDAPPDGLAPLLLEIEGIRCRAIF